MTKQYIDLLTEHKVKLLCLRERVSSDSSGFSPFSTKKQSVHYRILRSYKDTLHGRSVREVQSTNGRISFKEALDFQKTV